MSMLCKKIKQKSTQARSLYVPVDVSKQGGVKGVVLILSYITLFVCIVA